MGRLTEITLCQFRNLKTTELRPHERLNVLTGDNGQGKTNFIEGLYWLATLRPLRTNRLRELVCWGDAGASVSGSVFFAGLSHHLRVKVEAGERIALRERKPVRSADYFGVLTVIPFTPEDVGLVRGAPEGRRRYFDRAVFNAHPEHLQDVVSYKRALGHRNTLLRDRADAPMLAAYESSLASYGEKVMAARRCYIDELRPRFSDAFESIVGFGAQLHYQPSVDPGAFLSALALERERDVERGHTSVGPHVDDFVVELKPARGEPSRSARAYASQGQQRAIVLSLKIAEVGLLTETYERMPVLLLDDVSSELDAGRSARLFEFLATFRGQVFITTTDAAWLRIDAERRTWQVRDGALVPQES